MCALLVGVVGHFGGTLSYGEDYYTSIFRPRANVTLASSKATIPTTNPTTAPADPVDVFLFGTAEQAKQQRIRMRLASMPPAPIPPQLDAPINNDIDRFIVARWQEAKLDSATNPPEICDDTTFCRRVYLDLIGVIPTIEESTKFIEDKSPDKRIKLIDELLARETDYAANWTPFFEEAIGCSGPQAVTWACCRSTKRWDHCRAKAL